MTLNTVFNRSVKQVKGNAPELLTALGICGVVSTSYLVGKASFKAAHRLSEESPWDSTWERTKKVWKFYIPAAASGIVTVGCILGSSKAHAGRTAAAATAYAVTERAFNEYKDKVVETLGPTKDQKVRDAVAQDTVTDTAPSKEVFIVSKEKVMVCDLYSKRYFQSTWESLRRIENQINHICLEEHVVSLSEFYDMVGLDHTSYSDQLGWNWERMLTLEITTTLTPDQEPCLAVGFNYLAPL